MMIYPVHKQISFYVYSRFDEAQKILLMQSNLLIILSIIKAAVPFIYKWYRASKDVYEKLVRLYQLQDFVFINQEGTSGCDLSINSEI